VTWPDDDVNVVAIVSGGGGAGRWVGNIPGLFALSLPRYPLLASLAPPRHLPHRVMLVGADAVVMVEHTSSAGDVVEVAKGVASGDNIVPTGAEARRGDSLLAPGTRIDEAVIAVAASVGKARIQVYVRPKIAILSTGDELVGINETPGPSQIRNSNSYSLAAQVRKAGGEPAILPIAPDDKTLGYRIAAVPASLERPFP